MPVENAPSGAQQSFSEDLADIHPNTMHCGTSVICGVMGSSSGLPVQTDLVT